MMTGTSSDCCPHFLVLALGIPLRILWWRKTGSPVRASAWLHSSLNLGRVFARTAAKQFAELAQGDATYAT